MKRHFAIAIKEHGVLGYIASPYLVHQRPGQDFYTIASTTLSLEDTKTTDYHFTAEQLQMIRIIEEYSDQQLMKLFARKQANVKIFYQRINDELFEKQIRPYIERRLLKVIDILIKSDNLIFIRKDQASSFHPADRVKVYTKAARTVFNFTKAEEESRYHLSIRHEGKDMQLTDKDGIILTNSPCTLILGGALYRFNDIDGKKLSPFFQKAYISIPKRTEKKYFETFVLNSIKNYDVNAKGFEIRQTQPPKKAVICLQLNWNNDYVLIPMFYYGERAFLSNNKTKSVVTLETKETYIFYKFDRQLDWEQQQLQALDGLGLKKTQECQYFLVTDLPKADQKLALINWLNQNKQKLIDHGFEFVQKDDQKTYFTNKITLNIKLRGKKDWFDIYAMVYFGDYEIPFYKLRPYILNDKREYPLPNGEIAVLPKEWFAQYKDLLLVGKEIMGHLHIEPHHFTAIPQEVDKGISQKYLKGFERLITKEVESKLSAPKQLKASLRNYQKEGYNWLFQLHENKFGGCLADDMGLGKTLQTLSLLQYCFAENKQQRQAPIKHKTNQQLDLFADKPPSQEYETYNAASLIAMPVSLIHNWEREIRKFTPNIKVYIYLGTDRNKDEFERFYRQYDIILTSYGVLRNDVEILQDFEFFYLILDESQYIKNPESKIYQAVMTLKSCHRLVLTGTPIENSLVDMWAQMNFLNRGLLGNLSFFKNEFAGPIEKNNDEERSLKLQQLIQPFLLRRTKKEVAKDLPPLNEQVIYCKLPASQKEHYESEKSKIRNAVLEQIESGTFKKDAFLILKGLSTLRQLANHPRLVDDSYEGESGKFDAITRHIENLVAEKHKVLIFSSFVKHLNLLIEYIEQQGWSYAKLTGEMNSNKREAMINRFQNDSNTQLFLISIKAGGVGLNLTASDYVLILDPWWNPAVENQAINRAHRIGQQKKVFVYRFIANDTIEQKIRLLQERKSELAETFINTKPTLKNLSPESIKELFA